MVGVFVELVEVAGLRGVQGGAGEDVVEPALPAELAFADELVALGEGLVAVYGAEGVGEAVVGEPEDHAVFGGAPSGVVLVGEDLHGPVGVFAVGAVEVAGEEPRVGAFGGQVGEDGFEELHLRPPRAAPRWDVHHVAVDASRGGTKRDGEDPKPQPLRDRDLVG